MRQRNPGRSYIAERQDAWGLAVYSGKYGRTAIDAGKETKLKKVHGSLPWTLNSVRMTCNAGASVFSDTTDASIREAGIRDVDIRNADIREAGFRKGYFREENFRKESFGRKWFRSMKSVLRSSDLPVIS